MQLGLVLSPLRQPVPLFTAAYAIGFMAAYRHARRTFGSANNGGSPRWRNALGPLPQTVVLPLLLLARFALPSTASEAVDKCFIGVFASLMLFDFVMLELNPMMIAHHGTCLAGHTFAILTAPEAFVSYFASVVALEVGSGFSCWWWLWGDTNPALTPLYAYGMTVSNCFAFAGLLNWSYSASSLRAAARYGPIAITSILVYMRQLEMHNVVSHGRDKASTG
mmetsp:Transcript_52111/g.111467  ORF Transcript_52111/g.111467 Transcript_52111/m.111467 type:complete len:222 (-) Transcript_52111:187-852(-)|eukprot:CAMPEP_0183351802 /NCGR_PEP_ID=MMETSP0164_2-20130417/26261_1 /TAXON_ID=221442 /ORGANISM="Coccolithus pelagicus ssp braarudi, Strain PLY182g" /LENGTH=221 /DNA_ID=CAMNT_0025524075 /DNA_START=75 /DNA_END=740 /DNA_ORIENTATION=-